MITFSQFFFSFCSASSGYMAPEYVMHGQLSAFADVYSYGVLVLELISGKKNSTFRIEPDVPNLLEWVRTQFDWFINLENTHSISKFNDDDCLVRATSINHYGRWYATHRNLTCDTNYHNLNYTGWVLTDWTYGDGSSLKNLHWSENHRFVIGSFPMISETDELA